MNVTNNEIEQIIFWPAADIDAAFDRMKAAIGKPEENQEMQIFIRTMIFYYELASYMTGDIYVVDITTLYDMAKKGLMAELEEVE